MAKFHIQNALTILQAESLRVQLLDAVQKEKVLEIGCDDTAEVDVAGLQILLAAAKSAASRGHTVVLSEPVPARLADALQRGGFLTDPAANAKSPASWMKGAAA